jgi:hypothetical protein
VLGAPGSAQDGTRHGPCLADRLGPPLRGRRTSRRSPQRPPASGRSARLRDRRAEGQRLDARRRAGGWAAHRGPSEGFANGSVARRFPPQSGPADPAEPRRPDRGDARPRGGRHRGVLRSVCPPGMRRDDLETEAKHLGCPCHESEFDAGMARGSSAARPRADFRCCRSGSSRVRSPREAASRRDRAPKQADSGPGSAFPRGLPPTGPHRHHELSVRRPTSADSRWDPASIQSVGRWSVPALYAGRIQTAVSWKTAPPFG